MLVQMQVFFNIIIGKITKHCSTVLVDIAVATCHRPVVVNKT